MYVNCQYHAFAALPSGRNPGTHLVGGSATPTADLKASEKKKFLAQVQNLNRPVCSLFVIRNMPSRLRPTPVNKEVMRLHLCPPCPGDLNIVLVSFCLAGFFYPSLKE